MPESTHADLLERPRPGLRERKKQQTRARIIDVALELCDAHGFDATTVEQIADAADVSPRTINRYFASKEDIVIAPIAEWGTALADHLRAEPVTGNELQALMNAFLAVIDGVIERDEPLPFRWFQQMQRIIRGSAAVRAYSLDAAEHKTEQVTAAVAERLGAAVDSLPVRLVVSTWHTIMRVGTECEDQTPECLTTSARGMADAVVDAYHEFVRTCAAPSVSGPTSESGPSAR
ncbi:TetR/AcrR family transcriptional regulator [Nocardia huaxiensis]|uniref:TetR family transcriptional regulator n=1 Tax=Nocardia huaxiensis TaxID=2755382 RepID=A0A7D6VAS1_9NOCA|nr:TetR family transcriptional regulator [Nocardia huaxiensis]QLY31972.1 TetR family transcriptional regulator [Nocardia huaxiensis]UFS95545.1 TetR/AcrR family transcriptional regulator [Nocardia huaxiensis]